MSEDGQIPTDAAQAWERRNKWQAEEAGRKHHKHLRKFLFYEAAIVGLLAGAGLGWFASWAVCPKANISVINSAGETSRVGVLAYPQMEGEGGSPDKWGFGWWSSHWQSEDPSIPETCDAYGVSPWGEVTVARNGGSATAIFVDQEGWKVLGWWDGKELRFMRFRHLLPHGDADA